MGKTFRYSTFVLILVIAFVSKVSAGSISVSGNRSVTVGGSVNVTISPNDVVGKFSVTSSNNNVNKLK